MIRMDTIYTNDKGVPFERPDPADYAHHVDYLRAVYAYKDTITDYANRAFDEQFSKRMKRGAR
jgi:hypothetical protein